MFCKNCGNKIDDDSKFCRYCGTNQNNAKTEKTLHKSNDNIKKQNKPREKVEDTMKETSFYDNSYGKEYNAALVGGLLILANLVFLFSASYFDFSDSQTYSTYAIINVVWRILAANWCINIANRQNRSKISWGFVGFIVPNLALVILGLSKKLSLNSHLIFNRNGIKYQIYKSRNLFSLGYGKYEEFYFEDEKGRGHSIFRKNSSKKFFITSPEPIRFNSFNDYFEYINQ